MPHASDTISTDWNIRSDTVYLNHGSFGISPQPVRDARRTWQERLDEQPMDFYCRKLESAWYDARRQLAEFIGAEERNLVFVENATVAMNVVANSVRLQPGDEVLLTDHEYGAVQRIWERSCRQAGTDPPRVVQLPLPMTEVERVVATILSALRPATRLVVLSHITSPTAIILPVAEICQALRQRGVAVCVDGPHAIAQLPLNLAALQCDYYAASCHKWLCAPFGSGFLYVDERHHADIVPPLLSWGRLPPADCGDWSHEFVWCGTRNPAPYLAVPAAIRYLRSYGLEQFRQQTHELAQYARHRIEALTGIPAVVADDAQWYGSMTHLPLPRLGDRDLQSELWDQYGIEVPIGEWNHQPFIRVSCHLYNRPEQIDRLVTGLGELLRR